MTQVYIEIPPYKNITETDFIQLTVSTSMEISLINRLTENPIQNRDSITDHVVRETDKFNIAGMISPIPNLGLLTDFKQVTVQENLKKLQDLRKRSIPFILHFDNSQPPKINCLLSRLNFSKTSGMGESYKVDLSIQQVNISSQVTVSDERFIQQEEDNNLTSSQNTSANGNTVEEELENFSLFATAEDGISAFFTGAVNSTFPEVQEGGG